MKNCQIKNAFTDRTQSFNNWAAIVKQQPMISAEEEADLAQRIRKGDEKAVDKLVCANLRFAISIANQYKNCGVELVDLIEEANIGLIRAAKNFDETRGFKFISYAIFYIRSSIMDAIAKHGGGIRKSGGYTHNIGKINRAIATFEQMYERMPSAEEIAEMTDLSVMNVETYMGENYRVKSTEDTRSEDGSCTVYDLVPDEDAKADCGIERESLAGAIQSSLGCLTSHEQKVVCKFFGIGCEPMSYKEIGAELGLNHESIRQIRNKALGKLRKCATMQALRECA